MNVTIKKKQLILKSNSYTTETLTCMALLQKPVLCPGKSGQVWVKAAVRNLACSL